MYIPKFLKALVENKVHFRVDMSLIIGPMLKCLDDSIGQKAIISSMEYMFQPIGNMKRGNRALVDANVIASQDAFNTANSEHLDMEKFYLIEGDTPPIDVDIYKFNYPINIESPDELFLHFLGSSSEFLEDDATTLKNPILDKFINYLWDQSKLPMTWN